LSGLKADAYGFNMGKEGDSSVMQLGQMKREFMSAGKRGGANLQHTVSRKPREKQFLKEKKNRTKVKAGKYRKNNSVEAIMSCMSRLIYKLISR
jgi:hypothetical protein